VRYLLNGATVRQENVAAVSYWHVGLPAHAVLLAGGLPCESYLDTGNRAAFANGGTVVMARPDSAHAVWQRTGGGCRWRRPRGYPAACRGGGSSSRSA
jgi:hypothetical protein